MRKFLFAAFGLCAFLFLSLSYYSEAAEIRMLKLGILSKLNSTEDEFAAVWKKTFAPNNENLEVIVRFYESLTAMQMALSAGEINQMVLPEAAANYLLSQTQEYEATLNLRAKGAYGLAFGFRADRQDLRDKFNAALSDMRGNWRLAALEGRYITAAGKADTEPVKFEKFDGADTLRVAVTGDLPPIDFIAADGTPAGFNTAVLAEIGNALGMNVELISVESGARTSALASGRVDVVFWYEVHTAAKIQADVPDGVILSEPYYEWNNFIHIKKSYSRSGASSSSGWNVKQSIWELFWPIE
ncbi:MAG: transporter substrate-binding domain-containing protein [Synergistaceae bacterium]|nr:transporter substrate-binding domain-containing protein [Synergistaceae bacterium]